MTDAARKQNPPLRGGRSSASASAPSAAVFVVSFLAAFAAAGAAFGLGGFLGLGIGVVIGLVGAGVCAALAVQGTAGSTAKATALLDIALSDEAPGDPPAGFRAEPWATLYREVASGAESKRTASMAVLEIERLRRGAGGAPPETEAPHPARRAEDRVEREAPVAPPDTDREEPVAARDVEGEIADALRPYGEGLASIEADLATLLETLGTPSSPAPNGSNGTPAAMVDALVRTAADGIEDLAAGLMRANELAGVAERVTNRATLLALNAALEATRSGSEAFASIAEETRRLAEYAREATDTISRLSGEIEFKVGETIASIQSSSEDAKAAVASMGNTGVPAAAAAPATVEAIETLLARARALRERLTPPVAPEVEASSAPSPEEDTPETVAEVAAFGDTTGVDDGSSTPFEPAPRYAAAGDMVGASPESYDDPEPMVVTLDASAEDPSAEGDSPFGPSPVSEAEPEREREAEPEPEAERKPEPGPEPPPEREARNAPVVEPKIPDWLEGIRPGEGQ